MKKLILENNDHISIEQVEENQIVICKWKYGNVTSITKLCKTHNGNGHYYWLAINNSREWSSFNFEGNLLFHDAIKDAIKWNEKEKNNDEFGIFVFDSLKDLGEWLIKNN